MKLKSLLLKPFYHVESGSDQERKVMKSAISLAGFVVFFDLLSKVAIVEVLKNPGTRISVIPGIFDITYITNKGAAWGMFSGKGALLLTVSVVVFVLITFFLKQICEGWTERYYALLLVISGIIGNSADRIFRGAVVDFLRFHWQNKIEWPSFNIADSAICAGVCIFVLSMLIRPEKKKKDDSQNAAGQAD